VRLQDLYEVALVADRDGPPISTEHWPAIQHHILHLQPAASVQLEGDPPRIIRVKSFGGTEVAPELLRMVERLASTPLHVEVAKAAP
jgi:hypothetical protein